MSRRFANLLLPVLALLLLAYTTFRAHFVSLTHDECGSFDIWTNFDIFSCRTNPECWTTANLHWLYVLLMKMTVGLIGGSELAIRLPALMGHVVYLLFSIKLVKWVGGHLPTPHTSIPPYLIPLFGFVLLNVNPYLLDFHSLARGYGLAMGMMMMSLYYLARWVERGSLGPLLGTLGGAALAVLSNFTLLVYFACLLAVIVGGVAWSFLKKHENRVQRAKWAGLGSAAYVSLLVWLLANPISILRERGEFEWGRETFYETYKSVVHCSLYGGHYFVDKDVRVFGGLFLLLLLATTVAALVGFFKRPNSVSARFFLAAWALPALATVAALAQHWILGTKFQAERTAIMFIPLCALAVFLFFENWLAQKGSRWAMVLMVAIGVFIVQHFGKVAQVQFTSDWGYDAETRSMLAYLNEKIPSGTQVKLGVNWLYHPATTYYQRRMGYQFTEPPIYSKELFLDGRYDYYYVQPDDVPRLDSFYVEEKRFSWAGVLLRKK